MADPRFYKKKGPFTLEELAKIGQCEIHRGDPALLIHDVAPLNEADATCIGVLHNTKYQALLQDTKALACVLGEEMADRAPKNMALLVAKYPHRSFAMIATAFYPQEKKAGKIDLTAIVDPSATLGKDIIIGPLAIIGAKVELGDGVVVGAYTVIEEILSPPRVTWGLRMKKIFNKYKYLSS